MADEKKDRSDKKDDLVDEASKESFPASDPPSHDAHSQGPSDAEERPHGYEHLDHDEDIDEEERA